MKGLKKISQKLKDEFMKQVDTYVEGYVEKALKWLKEGESRLAYCIYLIWKIFIYFFLKCLFFLLSKNN